MMMQKVCYRTSFIAMAAIDTTIGLSLLLNYFIYLLLVTSTVTIE